MKTVITVAFRTALIIGVGCGAVLFFAQDSMIYMPGSYEESELVVFAREGGERLEFKTGEGSQTAFYLPPALGDIEPEKVWIVSGGNGALSLDYMETVQGWDAKWGFLFIDFPGYGLCEGDPSPKSIRANTTKAVEAVAEKFGWSREEISRRFRAFGHSIGSAVVLRAAADFEMEHAVVIAPFTSMLDMGRRAVGAPFCYVLKHRFDNVASLKELKKIGAQVTIFHGEKDGIVPVEMGRQLARDFPDVVTYEEIKGSGHNRIVREIKERLKAAATGTGK